MKKYMFFGLVSFLLIASGYMVWQAVPHTGDTNAVKSAHIAVETYIDVRTDQEWAAGHLDGASHFDLVKMQQGQLPDFPKDAPIALYCRSGHRAGEALAILQQNGFTNVHNAGGLSDLQAQGKKVCIGVSFSCD